MDNTLNEQINRMKVLMGLTESTLLEKMSNDDIYNKYYSEIPKEDFLKILESDPSRKKDGSIGKYTKWMLSLYQKNELKLEDLYKVTEYLTLYGKNFNHVTKKDINQIKSLPDLYNEVSKFIDNSDEFKSNSEKDAEIKKDAKKLYEDEQWVVIHPETKESSCYYGKGTQWCTAASANNYNHNRFDEYNKGGKLYINIDKKNDRKYQFHFEYNQFMDENDNSIALPIYETIGMTEGLMNLYVKLDVNVIKLGYKFDKVLNELIYSDSSGYFKTTLKSDADGITYKYGNIDTSKGNYVTTEKNGKLEGDYIKYYDNGAVWEKGYYQNGQLAGQFNKYDKGGELIEESTYENGRLVGDYIRYNLDGKVIEKTSYKQGIKDGKSVIYGNSGLKQDYNYKNGELDGLNKTYDNLGGLTSVGNWIAGKRNGESIFYSNYDNDGNPRNYRKYNYKNGELDGACEIYENNKLMTTGYYTNNEKNGNFNSIGEKEKHYIGTYDNGDLSEFKFYMSNKLVSTYENGVYIQDSLSCNLTIKNNYPNISNLVFKDEKYNSMDDMIAGVTQYIRTFINDINDMF